MSSDNELQVTVVSAHALSSQVLCSHSLDSCYDCRSGTTTGYSRCASQEKGSADKNKVIITTKERRRRRKVNSISTDYTTGTAAMLQSCWCHYPNTTVDADADSAVSLALKRRRLNFKQTPRHRATYKCTTAAVHQRVQRCQCSNARSAIDMLANSGKSQIFKLPQT